MLDLRGRLRRCFRKRDASAVYGLRIVVEQLIVHFLLGYRELRQCSHYQRDPIVKRVLGLDVLPDVSTISRTLAKADEGAEGRCRRRDDREHGARDAPAAQRTAGVRPGFRDGAPPRSPVSTLPALAMVARAGGGSTVPATVEGLAAGLESALSDRAALRARGETLRRIAWRNFTWKAVAGKLLAYFDEIGVRSPY